MASITARHARTLLHNTSSARLLAGLPGAPSGSLAQTSAASQTLCVAARTFSSSASRLNDVGQTPNSLASTSEGAGSSFSAPSTARQHRARAPIQSPEEFIRAIAKPRRGDLQSIMGALSGDDESEKSSMTALLALDGVKLKGAGVPVKERRYFLWCLERFKQGQHPQDVAYDVKPKKRVRGWGARVQNGIRVRGNLRPGEKKR